MSDNNNSSSQAIVPTIITVIFMVILIAIGIPTFFVFILSTILCIALVIFELILEENRKTKKREKEEKEKLYKTKSIAFYNECKSKGILFPTTADKFTNISKSKDMSIKQCKKMFDDGYNEIVAQQKQEEQGILDDIKAKLELKGKSKFVQGVSDRVQSSLSQFQAFSNTARKYLSSKTTTQARTHDWAIVGGMAQAIGGLGCGIAAAANTQLQNQAEIERASQTRAKAYKELSNVRNCSYTLQAAANNIIQALTNYEKEIDKAMTKGTIPQNYFRFSNTQLRESGTLSVTVTAKQKTSDENTIDGIACVIIKDKDEMIGEGYITTPGYISNCSDEEAQSISKMGFSNVKYQDIICFPLNNHSFSAQNSYTFEIKDIDVWRVNTKVLEESYKTLCDKYRDYAKKLDAAACDVFVSTFTT